MTDYANQHSQPADVGEQIDLRQVKNNAGGYVFEVSPTQRLRRFLILGVDSNTYYQTQRQLVRKNGNFIVESLKNGAISPFELYRVVVDVCTSKYGSNAPAPRKAPVMFVVALLQATADQYDIKTQDSVRQVVADLVRNKNVFSTLSDVYLFLSNIRTLSGKMTVPRRLREAIADFLRHVDIDYQTAKYGSRYNFAFKDVLRVVHPIPFTKIQEEIFRAYALSTLPEFSEESPFNKKSQILEAMGKELEASGKVSSDFVERVLAMSDSGISWEMLPTIFRSDKHPELRKAVFRSVLGVGSGNHMPLTALIRNLPALTAYGVFDDHDAVLYAYNLIVDADALRGARVHPMRIYMALTNYGSGVNRNLSWVPNRHVSDALQDALTLAMDNTPQSNKRIMHAIDESGSMSFNRYDKSSDTPYKLATTFTWIMLQSQPMSDAYRFTYAGDISVSEISRKSSFAEVQGMDATGGGTDLSLPIEFVLKERIPYDVIIIHTDNETWHGKHASELIDRYRQQVSPNCKFVVISYVANAYSVLSPDDKGSLNVVGFDTSVPSLIHDFVENG